VLVTNLAHVASGIAAMTLDGKTVTSDLIIVDKRTVGTHEVHVRLGP
jgi:hypothetical protein